MDRVVRASCVELAELTKSFKECSEWLFLKHLSILTTVSKEIDIDIIANGNQPKGVSNKRR